MTQQDRPDHAFKEHPLRRALLDEAHARPPLRAPLPANFSRLTYLRNVDTSEAEIEAHLHGLCTALGVSPPENAVWRHRMDVGAISIVWERHTEMTTITLMSPEVTDLPFSASALMGLEEGWPEAPGLLLSSTRLEVRPCDSSDNEKALSMKAFESEGYAASTIGKNVRVATNFRSDTNGFIRILCFDPGSPDGRLGRMVQKLLEMDTYRIAALLALPLAQEAGVELTRLEARLDTLSDRLSTPPHMSRDRDLLQRLTDITGAVQLLDARTHYRFAATRAYDQIMRERLDRLRETRIEGRERLSVFLERRQAPAMRTCQAMADRLKTLGDRVARANRLLSTRVNVALEDQNASLLSSMDRRAELQLRLQETVEGLSTIAITYYGTGLAQYVFKGLADGVLPWLNVNWATAIAAPVVFAISWFAIARFKKSLHG